MALLLAISRSPAMNDDLYRRGFRPEITANAQGTMLEFCEKSDGGSFQIQFEAASNHQR
jgi:hypothetical protein